MTRSNARESLDGCIFVADMLLRSWDYLRERLTSGMERSQAVSGVKEIRESIDRSSATFVKVRQLIEEAPARSGITPEDPIRLDDQVRRIEALRHLADELLRAIERPLPPLDPAAIPMKGNPLAGEGFKTTEQILANLRSGKKA